MMFENIEDVVSIRRVVVLKSVFSSSLFLSFETQKRIRDYFL